MAEFYAHDVLEIRVEKTRTNYLSDGRQSHVRRLAIRTKSGYEYITLFGADSAADLALPGEKKAEAAPLTDCTCHPVADGTGKVYHHANCTAHD